MTKKNTNKTGFNAPVYGRKVADNEKLVKLPNGNYKLVKQTKK